MPFNILKSDGTFLVTVNDLVTDTSATSLSLPARGASGYGLAIAENFVYLVENFANTSPPARALNGQLWFDRNVSLLRINNGAGWGLVGADGFGSTIDTLAGPTIVGNLGGTSNGANRIGGSTGFPLAFNGATTTISVITGEGKIICVGSTEAIPNASLPATIVMEGKTFDFKARFPNGLVAGLTLATDTAGYTYGGSTQFSDTLLQIPYLLSGDDTSTTVNTVIVTVPSAITSYSKYFAIESKIANSNTGAVQINVNGLGLRNVVRRNSAALSAGDLLAGYYYHFIYDGLQFRVDDAQANGYVGPTGPTGLQGPTGPVGAASTVVGPTGATGPAGQAGSNASLTNGEGIAISNGAASLAIASLTENDTISASDVVMFYATTAEGGQTANHHYKTTFGNLAALVLSSSTSPVLKPKNIISTYLMTTNQSVYNGVTTTVNLPAGDTTLGTMANGQFTVSVAGLYLIDFSVNFYQTSNYQSPTGWFNSLSLYVNNASTPYITQTFVDSGYYYAAATHLLDCTRYFAVGDIITFKAFNEIYAGTSNTLQSGTFARFILLAAS